MRYRDTKTHVGEGQMNKEAEARIMNPQAKVHQELPVAIRK